MPIKKNADLLERYLAGELGLDDMSAAVGIHGVILCKLRAGSVVATVDHLAKLAKWTGKSRVDIARALAKRVSARLKMLQEAVA